MIMITAVSLWGKNVAFIDNIHLMAICKIQTFIIFLYTVTSGFCFQYNTNNFERNSSNCHTKLKPNKQTKKLIFIQFYCYLCYFLSVYQRFRKKKHVSICFIFFYSTLTGVGCLLWFKIRCVLYMKKSDAIGTDCPWTQSRMHTKF